MMKGLLPGFLMAVEGPTSPRSWSHKIHNLRFFRVLMVVGGQAICRGVGVLVQHMVVMVPDKAEFRGGRWQKPSSA